MSVACATSNGIGDSNGQSQCAASARDDVQSLIEGMDVDIEPLEQMRPTHPHNMMVLEPELHGMLAHTGTDLTDLPCSPRHPRAAEGVLPHVDAIISSVVDSMRSSHAMARRPLCTTLCTVVTELGSASIPVMRSAQHEIIRSFNTTCSGMMARTYQELFTDGLFNRVYTVETVVKTIIPPTSEQMSQVVERFMERQNELIDRLSHRRARFRENEPCQVQDRNGTWYLGEVRKVFRVRDRFVYLVHRLGYPDSEDLIIDRGIRLKRLQRDDVKVQFRRGTRYHNINVHKCP